MLMKNQWLKLKAVNILALDIFHHHLLRITPAFFMIVLHRIPITGRYSKSSGNISETIK
jgi:hypothetical protein